MLTLQEIIESRIAAQKKADEGDLRKLPYKLAFIYGRLSSPGQVRDSKESVREIAKLIDLARKDGYRTNLNSSEIEPQLLLPGSEDKMWSDGEVTLDARDLGISGQLSFGDRKGLAELQKRVSQGIIGAVYLTEGVSRLSRDKDRILPYQLLKLLKEQQCRIRTPEGVWNPAIERDHDYLADQFEEAIGELKVMIRRMFNRKARKAGRGEYVGEPVPPGFIVPIIDRKPTGEYIYGKLEPYPEHAEIVRQIIEEFIRQGGSFLKTKRALSGLTFPSFPPELQHMARLTSLRICKRTASGYTITTSLIKGVVTNLKMIGVWQWGGGETILENHQPVVPSELFLEAYQLAKNNKKPKGRATKYEPMEWSGLLRCMNHPEPRRITSLNSKGRYVCDRDYVTEGADVCLDITEHFLGKPLTIAVLGKLDLTPFSETVIAKLEAESKDNKVEKTRFRRQVSKLEEEIERWQQLLPCCVDRDTGKVDREKEEFYWGRIREAQRQLGEIKNKPVPVDTRAVDYNIVRDFLKGISHNWYIYPSRLRNKLLKLIIEVVEVQEIGGTRDVEATIIWKAGFRQKVTVHRPKSNSTIESRWTKEEDTLLKMMYPSSSEDVLVAALPGRSWKAITLRAWRLKLGRKLGRRSKQENHIQEGNAKKTASVPIPEKVSWEVSDLISAQESSPRRGHRG